MAMQQHLDILKQGKDAWRQWRWQHPEVEPDFREADLQGMDLSGLNLCHADFTGSTLSGADLSVADLYRANLSSSNLRGVNLWGADLTEADLRGADLTGADLRGADLTGANLTGARLKKVDVTSVYLRWTILWACYGLIALVSLDTPDREGEARSLEDRQQFPSGACAPWIIGSSRRWRGLAAESEATSSAEDSFDGQPQTVLEEENRRLKQELEVVRQERDMLKKTIASFTQGQS
ncbi:MAG TPA: pentapeptide repeat-containing protein [Ktedonobacteraceae bacterium]|nr:pentapeptide repeat-containing protein [Ktedonobacteraceae bacterium]